MAGEILALLASITFPLSNAIFRYVDTHVTPAQINAIRTTIGAITFIILFVLMDQWNSLEGLNLELLIILLLSITMGQIIGDTAYFEAQKSLGTTIALAISSTFPFFTFIISILIGRTIPFSFYISGFFIGIGTLCISRSYVTRNNENISKRKNANFRAIIMGFSASVTWAFAIVLTDIGFSGLSDVIMSGGEEVIIGNSVRFPFAAFVLIVLSFSRKDIPLEAQNDRKWYQDKMIIIYLSVASLIGTSLGVILYTEAARLAGAAFTSLILTASPLVSIPIAWIINQEKITRLGFIGLVLTSVGVIIILV